MSDLDALLTEADEHPFRVAIQGVLWNASNYPSKVQASILGQDVVPLTDKVMDAVRPVIVAALSAHPASDPVAATIHARAIEQCLAALGVTDDYLPPDIEACGCEAEQGLGHLIWHLEQRALSAHPAEDLDQIEEEARKAVHKLHPEWHDQGVGIVQGSHYRAGFAKGARWLAESRSTHPAEETVTTVEELDALPVGSVVMEMTAEPFLGIPTVAGVFHKFPVAVQEPGRTPDEGWREWFVVAGHGARPAAEILLPARVLFRPVPEGSETA